MVLSTKHSRISSNEDDKEEIINSNVILYLSFHNCDMNDVHKG